MRKSQLAMLRKTIAATKNSKFPKGATAPSKVLRPSKRKKVTLHDMVKAAHDAGAKISVSLEPKKRVDLSALRRNAVIMNAVYILAETRSKTGLECAYDGCAPPAPSLTVSNGKAGTVEKFAHITKTRDSQDRESSGPQQGGCESPKGLGWSQNKPLMRNENANECGSRNGTARVNFKSPTTGSAFE